MAYRPSGSSWRRRFRPRSCVAIGYVAVRSWQAGPAGIWDELFRPRTLELLTNTVTLVVGVTFFAALLAIASAWCTERCDLPGRRVWRVLLCLPLALPSYVSSYAWSSLGPWFQGMFGAIVLLTLYSFPLFICRSRRRCAHGSQFRRRRPLPRAQPLADLLAGGAAPGPAALGGGALLVASHMLAEFGALAFLRVETFTTAIFDQYQLWFDNATAALLSAVLMALCLPVVMAEIKLRSGRRFARISRGSARPPQLVPLGRLTPVALVTFAWVVIMGSAVPMATLGFWLGTGPPRARASAICCRRLAAFVLCLAGRHPTPLLALPLVLIATRYRGRLARFADRMPYIVNGMPGIVVGSPWSPSPSPISRRSIRAPSSPSSRTRCFSAAGPVVAARLRLAGAAGAGRRRPQLGKGPFQAFRLATLPNLVPGIGAGMPWSRSPDARADRKPCCWCRPASRRWPRSSGPTPPIRPMLRPPPSPQTLVLVSGLVARPGPATEPDTKTSVAAKGRPQHRPDRRCRTRTPWPASRCRSAQQQGCGQLAHQVERDQGHAGANAGDQIGQGRQAEGLERSLAETAGDVFQLRRHQRGGGAQRRLGQRQEKHRVRDEGDEGALIERRK